MGCRELPRHLTIPAATPLCFISAAPGRSAPCPGARATGESLGYWGDPWSLVQAGLCGKPGAGPGWRGGGSAAGAPVLEGEMAPWMGVRVPNLLAQQKIAGKLNGTGFRLIAQILDVKKLSCADACANVLSLPLASSVKTVTDSPSLGCDPTSHPPAARSRGASHQLRDRNPVLAKSIPIPVLFHAHDKSELWLLSCPFLFYLRFCRVEEKKCKDNVHEDSVPSQRQRGEPTMEEHITDSK